jgi:geranylgeranyl diphosphate synthase type II
MSSAAREVAPQPTATARRSDACALDPAGQLRDLRELIDAYLEGLWHDSQAPAGLLEGLRYGLLGGGKRLRAILVLATADMLGHEPEQVLPIAAAIEMVHAYTLIHDDLPAMDGAEMRRGQPSCHRRFGEGIAILIGDTLFAEGIATLLREQRGEPRRVIAALAPLLTCAGSEGVAAGQYLDLTDAARAKPEVHSQMTSLKTASLFRAAVLSVAGWAGAPASTAEALDGYAGALGDLFQLRDDVLDVSATVEQTGKHPGADQRNGRFTHLDAAAADTQSVLERSTRLQRQARDALLPLGQQPTLLFLIELIGSRQR